MGDNSVKDYSVEWWQQQIRKNEKILDEKWRKSADSVVARYLDRREGQEGDALHGEDAARYNLFWVNTDILRANLYAQPPKPMVTREFGDSEDDVGRVAANIMERILIRDMGRDGSTTDSAMRKAMDDWLLPGLGQTWNRYDATIKMENIPAQVDPTMGIVVAPARMEEKLASESTPTDYVHWRDFFWSPARTWEEVWWVSRRVYMSYKTFDKRFGKEKRDPSKMAEGADNGRSTNLQMDAAGYPKGFKQKRIPVFECWCRYTKKAYWFSLDLGEMLDEKEDPLKLKDFFPCPEPLLATHTTNSLIPRPDYVMVQYQYDALDNLYCRVSLLESALRVVGVYNKQSEELKRLLSDTPENTMIAVDNWAMLAEGGGIKGQVDWFPMDMVVLTLDKLQMQMQTKIAQIYELTGMSDIMRGISNARETAEAQRLKAGYSSIRMQSRQQAVARFVTNSLRIKAEIIAKHFQPATILKLSQIANVEQDQALVQQAIELIKSGEMDLRIEIKEESLALVDYNAEKEMRVEFLTAVGQFISQTIGMAQGLPGSVPYLVAIIKWVAAGFRGAKDIESQLDQAFQMLQKAPPTPPEDPKAKAAEAKAQTDQAKAQSDQAIAQMKAQTDMQIAQLNAINKLDVERMRTESAEKIAALQASLDEQAASLQEMQAIIQAMQQHTAQQQEQQRIDNEAVATSNPTE